MAHDAEQLVPKEFKLGVELIMNWLQNKAYFGTPQYGGEMNQLIADIYHSDLLRRMATGGIVYSKYDHIKIQKMFPRHNLLGREKEIKEFLSNIKLGRSD